MHRDLKPHNVLISFEGEVKLADFGSSRFYPQPTTNGEASQGTNLSDYCGTHDYMSPELYNREPYDHKSDIFSMGLTLYEMIFPKSDEEELKRDFANLRNGVQPSSFIPQEFDDLFKQMVKVDPKMRPEASQIENQCLQIKKLLRKKETKKPSPLPMSTSAGKMKLPRKKTSNSAGKETVAALKE